LEQSRFRIRAHGYKYCSCLLKSHCTTDTCSRIGSGLSYVPPHVDELLMAVDFRIKPRPGKGCVLQEATRFEGVREGSRSATLAHHQLRSVAGVAGVLPWPDIRNLAMARYIRCLTSSLGELRTCLPDTFSRIHHSCQQQIKAPLPGDSVLKVHISLDRRYLCSDRLFFVVRVELQQERLSLALADVHVQC